MAATLATQSEPRVVLSARGLGRDFAGFTAVNNVDLDVEHARIHALHLGPHALDHCHRVPVRTHEQRRRTAPARILIRGEVQQLGGLTAHVLEVYVGRDADDPHACVAERHAQRDARAHRRTFAPELARQPAAHDGHRRRTRPVVFAERPAFDSFLKQHLPDADLNDKKLNALYTRYGPGAYSLPDQAYIARTHPLDLWLLGYLIAHPQATLSEVVADSRAPRAWTCPMNAPAPPPTTPRRSFRPMAGKAPARLAFFDIDFLLEVIPCPLRQ